MLPLTHTHQQRGLYTRAFVRSLDLPEVAAISKASFAEPWTARDFRRVWRDTSVLGHVAIEGERLVGYLFTRLEVGGYRLINLAVRPGYCRQGIGTRLVDRYSRALSAELRRWCVAHVGERDRGTQEFLRRLGFRAVAVERNYFGADDGYLFRRTFLDEVQA